MDHNGNAATLPVCVILAIAPYIEYIKIQVVNFYLINVNLCETNVSFNFIAIVKDSCLPTYLES